MPDAEGRHTGYGDPDLIRYGTPITSEQAARAVLRMVKSPLVGDVNLDPRAKYTVERIRKDCYRHLSKGERTLVDIAAGLTDPHDEQQAKLSAIGSLDPDHRRRVLVVLGYLHLGRDALVSPELNAAEWKTLFQNVTPMRAEAR